MLIEHDMDAVFEVAHRLTVMVNGEVIASGNPEEVRASPAVQSAYLGTVGTVGTLGNLGNSGADENEHV